MILMRIGFVGRGEDHASTRVRILQYLEPVRAMGHDVRTIEWQPRSRLDVAAGSLALLRLARWADVLVVLKPRIHPKLLSLIARVNRNLVVDIDDAVWTWGPVFRDRFRLACSDANAVVVGNEFLAHSVASQFPSVDVECLPTSVSMARYMTRPPH